MRVLVSWLRELVDVPVGVDELADRLTMCGFEVGAVEPWPADPRDPGGEPDAVLDLEITTNRPDCLSVLGIAREVATSYDSGLRMPPAAAAPGSDPGAEDAVAITIEDPDLCPRYAGALARVTVGPSPPWLARRLEAADVRPINNVVDVTNYVMLELGHPMHAFDLARLAGPEIRVRRARAGETVRTLDGADRSLDPDMLVIADAERPQAVAGVMGGAASEVGADTRTIVLEAAWFAPIPVRRTSRRLGLATDASYRFERGADVAAPPAAIGRALRLLADVGAGTPRGAPVDRFPAPPGPVEIRLRHARLVRVLGQTIDEGFVAPVLASLGFEPAPATGDDGPAWRVRVPTFRVDVRREEDLIEEVARHHGYDEIPTTFPAMTRPATAPGPWRARDRLVRRLLTGAGFSEAVTYVFVEEAAARAVHPAAGDVVALRNPLSERGAVLRPSLLPGLVDSVVHNRRRERHDVRLFEIGSRFRQDGGETPALGIAIAGAGAAAHWSAPARPADLFDLTGVVARLCSGFGLEASFEPAAAGHLVAGRRARVHVGTGPDRVVLGEAGQLDPGFAAARGMPGSDPVYVAEIDLRPLRLDAFDRLRAAPVPRHPSVTRDISIEIDDALPAARVRDTIRAAAGPDLVAVVEVDRYTGSGVAAGAVSLSLRLTFRAPDRTLTDAEVQRSTDAVLQALAEHHHAKQR